MFGIWSAFGQQYLFIFFSINSYFILGSIISCPYLVGSHDALDCSGAHRLGGLFWEMCRGSYVSNQSYRGAGSH